MEKTLAAKEYWEASKRVSRSCENNIDFAELFSRYLKRRGKDRVAVEIGCVPGLYLAYVCKHFGYFPEGIDFVRDSGEITGKTLRNFGLHKYQIYVQDFLEWKPDKKYDLVLSLGFVEHFSNPDEIIKKHISLIKKGGQIVLEVPNFAYGQKWLHHFLDGARYLSSHNTKVMNASYFKGVAKKFNLKVDYLGYYGGLFRFWGGEENAPIMKMACHILALFGEIAKRANLNNKYFSPFLVMVAEKNDPLT